MQLNVGHKLFLTFLLTTGLVIAGMVAFMSWSFERSFVQFIEARQQERVDALVERLGDYYGETGNWDELQHNRRLWFRLLAGTYRSDSEQQFPPQLRMIFREDATEPSESPPPEGKGRFRHQPVERRFVLLDAKHNAVFGQPDEIADMRLNPIQTDGSIVGYLGIRPGPSLERIGEVRFLEQQISNFIWIALAAILLSAALAMLLAGGLTKSLKAFTRASQSLADGRYDTRIPVESGDELGRLARDFNALAAALERTEQQRRQWVADISHELRTPLAVLRGEIEAVQDGMRPLDQQSIDSLHAEVMRLSRLVDDLYQLSMSDLGSLSYRATAVDPVAILKDTLNHFEPEFRNKAIRTQVDIKPGLPATIQADPDRLAQLFRNLLANSLRYTDNGGQLSIDVHATDNKLMIDIEDSAPGVKVSELSQLFERFYRVESSRNRAHGGAGLGLAICRNIIEAHKGTISAHASQLGGLRIHIELPIA